MKRFKNILYFADGALEKNHALVRAVQLARSNGAWLTVIDVLEKIRSSPDVERVFGTDINQILRDRRQQDLDKLVDACDRADMPIHTRVATGIAFVQVIRTVMVNDHDLLIKAAKPPQGLSERVLGSTDMHLLRKCPCPVWIDRPNAAFPYASVLAAVELEAEQGEGCDRMIMDLASSLAQRESARLDVVHAWEMEGESLLRDAGSRVSRTEFEHLGEITRNKHKRLFDALLSDYAMKSEDKTVHLIKGEAAPTIRSLSRDLESDLVVMGSIGRTGIPGLIIGNTAEEVMQNIDASILAIKPAGFVSPVALEE